LVLAKLSDSRQIKNQKNYNDGKLRASSKSKLLRQNNINESESTEINTIKEEVMHLSDNIHSIRRLLPTVCASTCEENRRINLRIYPKEDNEDTKEFVQNCSISQIKAIVQGRKDIYLGKVCVDDVLVVQASDLIAKLEGGTKTTRSKTLRIAPKPQVQKVDCNGGCCKECDDADIKKYLATPSTPEGRDVINDCAMDEPQIVESPIGESNHTFLFNICKKDKHVLKQSKRDGNMSYFKRQKDKVSSENIIQVIENTPEQEPILAPEACEENTCCKACVNPDAIYVLEDEEQLDNDNDSNSNKNVISVKVKTKEEGFDFVESCATSINGDPVEDGDNTVFPISICPEDWKTIVQNSNIISAEKISSIQTMECVKTCTDETAQDVLVSVLNDEGIRNALQCAKEIEDGNTEVGSITIMTMSICKDDLGILSKMNGVQRVEINYPVSIPGDPIFPIEEQEVDELVEKNKGKDYISEITDACDSDTECCLNCKVEDAKKALIMASTDEAVGFAKSCAKSRNSEKLIDETGTSTILAMSICEGDWNVVENHDGITLEEDFKVGIPPIENEELVEKNKEKDYISEITDACDSDTECCLNCKVEDATKALIMASTEAAVGFAKSCAKSRNREKPIDEIGTSTILAMSICEGDWNIVKNHEGIILEEDYTVSLPSPEQPVIDENRRKDDSAQITEICNEEECCLSCDKQDVKKALITATDVGIGFARTCAVEGKDKEPIAKIGDDTILAMSICEGGDWNKVENHDGIKFIEKDYEVNILNDNNN